MRYPHPRHLPAAVTAAILPATRRRLEIQEALADPDNEAFDRPDQTPLEEPTGPQSLAGRPEV